MSVYVAAHKLYDVIDMPDYFPLQVGAALGEELPYIADNTGNNISAKNKNYCELTGIYWIWKNRQDSYKGLVHYRRYFKGKKGLLTSKEINKILDEYDIIVAKPEYLRESAYQEFVLHSGYAKDLDLLREAVKKIDDSVLAAYDEVFSGNKLHLYNMFIAKGEDFDKYCTWLFSVFDELEKHVDMTDYTPYQQRLYGFLSERLLNVWIKHNNLKIKQLRVINTEQNFKETMRIFLRRQKNKVLFMLGK